MFVATDRYKAKRVLLTLCMVQYINGVLRITCTSLRVYTVHEQVLIVNEMSLRVYTVHLQVLTGLVACVYLFIVCVGGSGQVR